MITTRLYLDTRRVAPEKPAQLKIALTYKSKVAYIYTGLKIHRSEWNSQQQRPVSSALRRQVESLKVRVDTIIYDQTSRGRFDGLGIGAIRDIIAGCLNPADTAPAKFLDILYETLQRPGIKPRTREIYEATAERIRSFSKDAACITFADITVGWLDRFDAFLARTSPKRNARNIHLRNIRAVFNYARKREITTLYPFLNYDIRPEQTVKRAMSAEQIRTLANADLQPWQCKYRDFFMISFLLIGMNTEDLLHAEGVYNGRLEYRRAKTHRPYSIEVLPECARILEKYAGDGRLLDILEHYSCTHHWTSKVDRELKTIADNLGLPKISMYWARHSWATIAAELDIPKDTIAAALGHSGNTVTDIYINFDRSKIDRANRQVADYVLYGKKPATVLELLKQNFERLEKKISG